MVARGWPGDVVCCGPGAAAIDRWAASAGSTPGAVVLVGLGGAIRNGWRAASAHVITEVRGPGGETWIPSLAGAGPRCVVTSTETVTSHPDARHALAEERDADLVDLESVAFASAATALGWTWGIVRGISDDVDTPLPPDVGDWVDSEGVTRPGAVLAALLRHPRRIMALVHLGRNSRRAMAAAVDQLLGLTS